MTKRRYSRRSGSLLEMATRSNWQYSAALSAVVFGFYYVALPLIGNKNRFVQMAIPVLEPFAVLLGGIFALIALINFFRQTKSRASTQRRQQPPSYRPTSSTKSNVVPIRGALQKPANQVIDDRSKASTQGSSIEQETETQRPSAWSIDLLQKIEWKLFEDVSAAYYNEKGIRAELTKLGADGGIDIKLFQDDSGQPTSLVQCKAWNTKLVGVKAVREFLGVMSSEKIAHGVFMASGAYSSDAIEFADANGITLIDGEMFLAMMLRLPADAQQRLLDLATRGDYTTPSCPSCGVKMLRRTGKHGDFWGCMNYPRCHRKLFVNAADV